MKNIVIFFLILGFAAVLVSQSFVELFPFEGFDRWLILSEPPEGWIRIVGGSESTVSDNANDWHPTISLFSPFGSWTTRPVAQIYWNPIEITDDYLISPSFNPTEIAYDSIILVYETDYSRYALDSMDNCVLLSTDDGANWTETLAVYGVSSPTSSLHETRRINISSLVMGRSRCKIAFHAHRNLVYENWWEIDNICVYGYPDSTGYIYEYSSKPDEKTIIAYPNPFNSSVRISISPSYQEGDVRRTEGVQIEIFDIAGRKVANLGEATVGAACMPPVTQNTNSVALGKTGRIYASPTTREFLWQPDASVISGVYLVRTRVSGETVTKRVVLLK